MEGANNWTIGTFRMKKDYDIEQYHACMADTCLETAQRLSNQVVNSNFGAYFASGDKHYSYYTVLWKGKPWQVKEDKEIEVRGMKYKLKEGEWVCRGVWLKHLQGGRNWVTMTVNKREAIVNMKNVGIANLKLRAKSEENPLRVGMPKKSVKIASKRGVWRVSDADHAFLLEESRLRETNNEYDEKLAAKMKEEETKKMNPNSWTKKEKKEFNYFKICTFIQPHAVVESPKNNSFYCSTFIWLERSKM